MRLSYHVGYTNFRPQNEFVLKLTACSVHPEISRSTEARRSYSFALFKDLALANVIHPSQIYVYTHASDGIHIYIHLTT